MQSLSRDNLLNLFSQTDDFRIILNTCQLNKTFATYCSDPSFWSLALQLKFKITPPPNINPKEYYIKRLAVDQILNFLREGNALVMESPNRGILSQYQITTPARSLVLQMDEDYPILFVITDKNKAFRYFISLSNFIHLLQDSDLHHLRTSKNVYFPDFL